MSGWEIFLLCTTVASATWLGRELARRQFGLFEAPFTAFSVLIGILILATGSGDKVKPFVPTKPVTDIDATGGR